MKSVVYLLTMILFAGFSLLTEFAEAQIYRPGPQVASFYSEIDDSEQPYGLYIPPGYDPQKKYPLVIMLHGAGSNHRLALRRVFGKSNLPGQNDAEASRVFPGWKEENYIVASPFARGTMGYVGIPEADVMRVIEECKASFSIDEDRVYLTGLSMGGGGTLYIGLTHPGLFAALAPVCPAPPPATDELMGNALNLPVVIYQGGADPVVKAEGVRSIVETLEKNGGVAEYHEFPGVQHNVWIQAYQEGNIFRWFDGISRNPFPLRVNYSARWYKYNSAYWVLFDRMIPGKLSSIDAAFTGKNLLEIKTENLGAFTLKLKGHPSFDSGEALTVKIDGSLLRSSPKYNHSFTKEANKWVNGRFGNPVMSKQPGLEGPMFEVFNSRVLVVYGTQGASGEPELDTRRQDAQSAASFSSSRRSFSGQSSLVNPRIISDKQVTEDDFRSSNLLLLGTRETNAVIARLADKLPLQLNPETKGYGLVYCYPVNGKLVIVASGTPFWTFNPSPADGDSPGPDGKPVRRFSFATGSGARMLAGRKDFLLFKENGEQIVAEGYFSNEWQLQPDDLRKMQDSGAVSIK